MIRADLTDLVETTVLSAVANDRGDAGARVLAFPWYTPADGKTVALGGLRVEALTFVPETARDGQRVVVAAAASDLAAWALAERESS